MNDEVLIIAEGLLDQLAKEWEVADHQVLGKCKGKDLEGVITRHPFADRNSP